MQCDGWSVPLGRHISVFRTILASVFHILLSYMAEHLVDFFFIIVCRCVLSEELTGWAVPACDGHGQRHHWVESTLLHLSSDDPYVSEELVLYGLVVLDVRPVSWFCQLGFLKMISWYEVCTVQLFILTKLGWWPGSNETQTFTHDKGFSCHSVMWICNDDCVLVAWCDVKNVDFLYLILSLTMRKTEVVASRWKVINACCCLNNKCIIMQIIWWKWFHRFDVVVWQ
jgi:hypothetical protein